MNMNMSIPALVIVLRETIEASIIIGIFIAFLEKTGNQHAKKDVWKGVGIATVLSLITGAIIFWFFGEMEESSEQLFEGTVMLLTSILLTTAIFWMMKTAHSMKHSLEQKIEIALDEKKKQGITLLAFIVVGREGLETVLFLAGFSVAGNTVDVLIGGTVGLILAMLLGAAIYRGSVSLSLRSFFLITSAILIFTAAGLLSTAIHEFQELGVFGSSQLIWNMTLFDLSGVLNDKTDFLGVLLRSLFGYQDKPSLLEIGIYVLYLLFATGAYYLIKKNNTKK